jgi:hypothetical protein
MQKLQRCHVSQCEWLRTWAHLQKNVNLLEICWPSSVKNLKRSQFFHRCSSFFPTGHALSLLSRVLALHVGHLLPGTRELPPPSCMCLRSPLPLAIFPSIYFLVPCPAVTIECSISRSLPAAVGIYAVAAPCRRRK